MNDIVFLVDVDETLLNNDAVIDDLKRCLVDAVGVEGKERYWALFEQLWDELGYADYLGALQRYRVETSGAVQLLGVASFLLHYPFSSRLYPGALEDDCRAQAAPPCRDSVGRRRRAQPTRSSVRGSWRPLTATRSSTSTRKKCSTTSNADISNPLRDGR
jgi:hypothetical protein